MMSFETVKKNYLHKIKFKVHISESKDKID